MALQIRRGTNADRVAVAGVLAAGELYYCTDTKILWVGDGSTAGGTEVGSSAPYTDLYNVKLWGAVGDGVADDTAAIQSAIDAAMLAGGGVVQVPPGQYAISGSIYIENAISDGGVTLHGAGKYATKIVPTGSGYRAIVYTGNWGGVRDLSVQASSTVSGITGLYIGPADMADTATRVDTSYNMFSGLYIAKCAEGVHIRPGPIVGGLVSSAYFNVFIDIVANWCLRGVLLDDGPNALCSGVNRNQFYSVRIGLGTNTGLHIKNGDTNQFYGLSLENVDTGTSPSAIPTGVIIEQAGSVSTRDCNFNNFFGPIFEACDVDIACSNKQSSFVAHNAVGSKMDIDAGKMPGLMIGSNGATAPQFVQANYYDSSMNDTAMTTPSMFYTTTAPNTGSGFQALRGSLAMCLDGSTGRVFTKSGNGDTDWSAPGDSANKNAVADDTTPSVLGARFLSTPANSIPTEFTALDDGAPWQIVTIFATSSTNAPTISDGSGNFRLSANWTPGVGDTITLMTSDGTTWFEIARSNN